MPLLEIILLGTTAVVALPPPDGDNSSLSRSCEEIFQDNGMNYTTFSLGAAHGLHSISLEEIRHFFEADAPELNKIPVINTDFRSEQSLLFNAPLWGFSDRFSTWSLKIMDFFMLNDKPYFLEQVRRYIYLFRNNCIEMFSGCEHPGEDRPRVPHA